MPACHRPISARLRATSALTGVVCLLSAPAYGLPVGGSVAGGSASIAGSGSTMTITQSSSRAIINWQNFDIGSGETVNFLQPSSSSIALNRVTGSTSPTQILGTLNANGQVWIVNPSGVFFGAGSQVNVAGLVATSANISDSNFMSGQYVFDIPGSANASITNAGSITVADMGLVAFVAPGISNSGTITARLGKVQLGSGDTFTLDLYGDGLINLAASPAITSQLIDNSGTISADGGQVLLSAAAASQEVSSLINMDGVIEAESIGTQHGQIILSAKAVESTGHISGNSISIDADNIAQQGTMAADTITESFIGAYIDNAASTTTANTISITGTGGSTLFASGGYTGSNITMAAGNMWLYAANLDASGTNGGGNIFLGDNNTQNVSVNFYSSLKADALTSGDGGLIKVWSTQSTTFGASTSARGGATSGNGGLIEISSAGQDYVGGNTPDVSAPHGNAGTFLLDPHNITISDNSTTGGGLAYFPLTNPDPSSASGYGWRVIALGNGNIVVVNYQDSFSAVSSGAVYLFNGSTGALISTLRGSQAGDAVGYGSITALTGNNNFVIDSYDWANGAATQAGAVTWGNGTTGVSGVVSSSNSLVGSQTGDSVGIYGISALTNGNYAVASAVWDNGAVTNAGAVTWGNGTTGITGAVSSSNSLVGSSANDEAGVRGITILTNGNYVVDSPIWHNGGTQVGAVTWGNGTTGISGVISGSNSLIGSQSGDSVGNGGITALPNGNYVVDSFDWANGAVTVAGAVTWGSGTMGIAGTVSSSNSLVGSQPFDQVGAGGSGNGTGGVTVLSSGNYVVDSPFWSGAVGSVGAVTWGNGTIGITGTVSSSNSLVGSQTFDAVGSDGVVKLSNGNYIVKSSQWANGAASSTGAVTWGSGTTGITGAVSSSNSLVGSTAGDQVGVGNDVTALTNGNYVVGSPFWDNGAVANVGAVTWGNGTTGVTGAVSSGNSLVGSQTNDQVGLGGITALSNGNYVVSSYFWNNGAVANVGAATWGNGATGITGTISSGNSLIGSTSGDKVGYDSITALTNGNYVVASIYWANGAASQAGAVTWGNGTTGITGTVSSSNSLVGSQANDLVGTGGILALSNGDYVVKSWEWANGGVGQAGAATWGNGTAGITGAVSSSNSLVGSHASDEVGSSVTALSNGNYIVKSIAWDNGATADVGAATWGSGTSGVTGTISTANSIIGPSASAALGTVVEGSAEGTFIVPFTTAGAIYVSPSSGPGALASSSFLPNADFTVDTAYVAATLGAGTNVTLQAMNDITIANSVTKTAGADATLTLQAGNDISFSNNAILSSTAGKLNTVLDATGTGSITMDTGSGITSNGGDVTLANSGGYFINNSGAGALSPGSGRWLIYSKDSSGDTYNGLSAGFTQYSCTYGSCAGIPGTGNGFLYSIAGGSSSVTVPPSVNQALSDDYSDPEYKDSRAPDASGRLFIEVDIALLRMLGLSPDDPNRWWDKVVH